MFVQGAVRTLTGDEVNGLVGGSTVQHSLLALALRLQLAVDLTEQVHQLDAHTGLASTCRDITKSVKFNMQPLYQAKSQEMWRLKNVLF